VGLKPKKGGTISKRDIFHNISKQQEVSSFALPLCFKETTVL